MGENRFAHGQTVSTVSSGVSDPVYPGSATKGKASFAATKGKAGALQLQKAKLELCSYRAKAEQALRLQDGKCPVESAEGGAAKPQFHRAATVGIDFFKGTRLALRERIGESG